MANRLWLWAVVALVSGASITVLDLQPAAACGGFFCQGSPIDQNAERIIFTQNRDGTLSAYVQIQYTGSAPDFSWILPIPEPIGPENLAVPEDAMAAFTELEVATDPVFVSPEMPQCALDQMRALPLMAEMASDGGVDVFSSGEVGPYGFNVIGSEDPDALVNWLRDNDYRVTAEMEPLIDLYVQERFVFLAMRLLPDSNAQDVQPIKLTYPSERPMIPLRLTAVAANQDMAVMVWIYADRQARPVNYAELAIPYKDLTFFGFGGNSNYRTLMGERADEYGGQAFITEYASPTRELAVNHPLLQELRAKYPYVTRLNTVISPEEMTVDPIFDYDAQRKDVSNIHDLSGWTGLYDCERAQSINIATNERTGNGKVGSIGGINSGLTLDEVITPSAEPDIESEIEPTMPVAETKTTNQAADPSYFWTLIAAGAVGGLLVLTVGVSVLAGVALSRRGQT